MKRIGMYQIPTNQEKNELANIPIETEKERKKQEFL